MKNFYRFAMLMAAIAMLMISVVAPCGAQLVGTTFGFPSVFQSSDVTAFTKDLVAATDNEAVNIDFGAGLGLGTCGLGGFTGFPSISQVSEQTYYAEHTDFYHSEEVAAFNYPFASVGGCGLPGLAGMGIPFC